MLALVLLIRLPDLLEIRPWQLVIFEVDSNKDQFRGVGCYKTKIMMEHHPTMKIFIEDSISGSH